MSYEVTQWLAEIKSLQRQLAEMRQERDEAYKSAANWRRLYDTEAQQRRTEAKLFQQTIDYLRSELARLQGSESAQSKNHLNPTEIAQEIEQLGMAELKARLVEVTLECDRIRQSLQAEQVHHAQTRKSLTTALGDAVDQLTKERLETAHSASPPAIAPPDAASPPAAKPS